MRSEIRTDEIEGLQAESVQMRLEHARTSRK